MILSKKKHLYFSRTTYNHTTETFKARSEFRVVHRPLTIEDGVEVEKVVALAKTRGPVPSMAFVKWEGFDEEHNSWIDVEDVPEDKKKDRMDFEFPLTFQMVQTNPHTPSQHRYSTRRRPRLDKWDISNVVVNPSDSFIPLERPDKIDVPTFRVLTDEDQNTVGKDELEDNEEEHTEDEYYERLHAEMNERIQEMIQRATVQKKVPERSKPNTNTSDDEEEDEDEEMDTT